MATETTISRPAPFVEDIGTDLAKQAVAITGVPVVSGGLEVYHNKQVKLQKDLKQDKMLQEHFN